MIGRPGLPSLAARIRAGRAAALVAVCLLALGAVGADRAVGLAISVKINGAGSVDDTERPKPESPQETGIQNCASPATTPSLVRAASQTGVCLWDYGLFAGIVLAATPQPGYTFAGWQGVAEPVALICQGSNGSGFLASGTCNIGTGLVVGTQAIEVRFADGTAQQTVIDTGPPALTTSASASFTFHETPSQTGTGFQCKLDAGSFFGCASGIQLPVADGAHTMQIRAVDPSGNTDSSPATWSWTIDTIPPETSISAGPASLTNETGAQFAFSSEFGAAFECAVDGSPFGTCTGPGNTHTATVGPGGHTFQVRARDPAGNADATPASRSWTVDTAPPETTITSGPMGLTTSATTQFAFSSTEAGTFRCARDAGAFAGCSSPVSVSVPDGVHTFRVQAVDEAGNVDESPAERSWTVDTSTASPGTNATGPGSSATGPATSATGSVIPSTGEPQRGLPASTNARVRFRVKLGPSVRLLLLRVVGVPTGARVAVTCRRGCALRRAVVARTSRVTLTALFRGTALPLKSVVEIHVTKPGLAGQLFRFRFGKRGVAQIECRLPVSGLGPSRCAAA